MSDPAAYPRSMRALHWLVVVAVASQVCIGIAMSDESERIHPGLFGWHTSLGILLLLLVALRLANRLRCEVPPLPATMPSWERAAAAIVHRALYGLMLAIPVLGYLAAGAATEAKGVEFFGLELPALVDDPTLADEIGAWHGTLVWTFVGLLIVHVAAVVRHAFFDRPEHDVLRRMV